MKPNQYSFELKKEVVMAYLNGADGLRKTEVNKLMKSANTNPKGQDSEKNKDAQLKELKDKLLMLEIENAYLKELRRLRLDGQNQKHPKK